MGISLGFHILFAAAGIALPLLMVVSDVLHRRTGEPEYLELSKRLAKGTAVLFAVGAVSGTVLSFELGLLWPAFMGRFGEVIGLPFALEGFAFFTEAIFLGIYLYGRDRVSPALHLFSGVAVAVSGAASAFFVTLVNAFMNLPAASADPLDAMFSPPWLHETIHVLLSCYAAVGFAMAGIHAWMLLRHGPSPFHRRALAIALAVGGAASLVQPLSGDLSAKHVAQQQPVKLAAAEAHFQTGPRAPLHLGGIPDLESETVRYGLELPGGLSFLAFGDRDATVQGLRDFPRELWPPVFATHVAFQLMVGCGMALAALSAALGLFAVWRRRLPHGRGVLRAIVGVSPLGLVAMEAGWLVTELGRQPWIVRGRMLTSEAVTPFPHLAAPFWMFGLLYLLLGAVVVYLLRSQVAKTVPRAG
jgi:cytochrome bd ubiquinol oxidase subunit I